MKLRYLSLLIMLSLGTANIFADPADAYFDLRFEGVKPSGIYRTADSVVEDDDDRTVKNGYVDQIPDKYLLENKDLRIPFLKNKQSAPLDSVHLFAGGRNIKLQVAARATPYRYTINLPGNNNECRKGQTYVQSPTALSPDGKIVGDGQKGLCVEQSVATDIVHVVD